MVKPLVPPMVDILGPYVSTPQHVIARPGKVGPAAGAGFSWLKDCTDDNAEDGTPLTAEFVNNLKAQLLTFFQESGISIDDADAMLAYAVQSGSLNYGTAVAGGGNAWTVTLPLPPPVFPDGLRCWFHAPATPTGNVTLNVSGGGGNLVGPDGVVVGAGDLLMNQAVEVVYRSGVGWQMVTSRLRQFQRVGRRQVFLASGSFVVPAANVLVTAIGGGGGGSASGNGTGGGVIGNSGGGGGGGGFAQKAISGLAVGSSVSIIVGAGGVAGTAGGGGGGGPGGTSSFGGHCSATGGDGALWGENTLANGGNGGAGIGGDINIQGTDGGCTGPNVSLAANASMSDTHRIYNRGGIAAGGLSTMALGLSTGAAGRGFGTGGGGATGGSALAGGAGAPGIIFVEW